MDDLQGAVAVITGGARGIGFGIARALAREGVSLALCDIHDSALESAARELSTLTEVRTHHLDVSNREAFDKMAEDVDNELGQVRILVNNAGVGIGVLQSISEELTYATWDYVMGVNLEGVNNGIQTLVPRMIRGGLPCHVVNTASAAGLAVFADRSSGYTYHASKFAVIGMSEALRRGLEDDGVDVGVSVLIPGMVATGVGANSLSQAPTDVLTPERRAALADVAARGDAALQRFGRTIDDVGELTVAGIKANQLYLPTDRLAEEALLARCAAIVDAMPAASEFDTALREAMR